MLDLKFVRSNPEVVRQNIKNKFQDEKLPLVDEVLELDYRNQAGGGSASRTKKQDFKTDWRVDGTRKEGRGGGSQKTSGRKCG